VVEIDWKQESQRFEGVAELYEAHRPGYPQDLIETLISYSGLLPGDRILEVGSGTGKATALLAGRGYSITCLEPGRSLAEVARRKFRHHHEIRFEYARFEDWLAPKASFNLLFSAQAYHWVPKEVRMSKAAWTLKPEGCIALLYNLYSDVDSALRRDLDQIYRQLAPEISERARNPEAEIQQITDEIRDSGLFYQPLVVRHPWSRRMDTATYLSLLNTYSDHLRLTDDARRRLFDGVAGSVERYGGQIDQQYLGVLHIARVLGG
jgi:ubiquinone/menaquinone biosynthesis C-methylase UbiE